QRGVRGGRAKGGWGGRMANRADATGGGSMRKSHDRLLVTHVGSLPRGGPLNELLIRSEAGEPVELEVEVERRVAHVFAKQREIGIDICNDGEQGRVGFQTYVAQRMSGFAGQSNRPRPRDMSDFPDFGKILAERFPRRGKQFNAPQAVADVHYKDTTPIDAEVPRPPPPPQHARPP